LKREIWGWSHATPGHLWGGCPTGSYPFSIFFLNNNNNFLSFIYLYFFIGVEVVPNGI
jgi:hypothetical protein